MTYCFLCPNCRTRASSTSRDQKVCSECSSTMVRDYRTEAVGIGQGVRVLEKDMQDTRNLHGWAERAGS